jgi:hypothetical protein
LEAARQAASEVIDVFYDPRRNVDHAGDLQRSHRFKGEMVSLMQSAEAWATAELAAGEATRAEAKCGSNVEHVLGALEKCSGGTVDH